MPPRTDQPRISESPFLNKIVRRLVTTKADLVYAARHRLARQKRSCLLFGLQRSGTNYVEAVLKGAFPGVFFQNTNLDRNDPLQKHARLYADKSCIPTMQYMQTTRIQNAADLWTLCQDRHTTIDCVIVVARNPFHWLRSYQRWAVHCSWPRPHHHYVREWTLFYGLWYNLSRVSRKIAIVQYESLLTEDTAPLRALGHLANLDMPARLGKRPIFVKQSDKFGRERLRQNLSSISLLDFPDEERDLIAANLDLGLVAALGYDLHPAPDRDAAGRRTN